MLTKPLASVSADGSVIRSNVVSGHPTYLVINYEFTPGFDDISDLTYGGRINHWLTDQWQIGINSQKQETGINDHNLKGVDLTYRLSDQSYLKFETAQTRGLGTQGSASINGGFHFNAITEPVNTNKSAQAFRLESGFAFKDFGGADDNNGSGQFYWQTRDSGFSGPGQFVRYDTKQLGLKVNFSVTDAFVVTVRSDLREEDGGIDKFSGEVNLTQQLSEQWQISAGLRAEETTPTTTATTQQQNTGERVDLAVQINYQHSVDWGLYAFTQGTLSHDDSRLTNNRLGLGGDYLINNDIRLSTEISSGNQGFGALVGTEYQYSKQGNIYLNYALDPDRTDNNLQGKNGQLVSGVKHRFSNSTSVYGEQRYQYGNQQSGLTQAYGIEYQPLEAWLFGLSFEYGSIESPGQKTLERNAVAFNTSYADDGFKYSGALEYREDKRSSEERDSYLVRNNLSYKVNPDWRAQLRVDFAISNSDIENKLNSDYTEALLGFAYRPVANDNFNALLTYM